MLIHGSRYDYSLVTYTGCTNKIKIICKKHGVFEQAPSNHLSSCGCPLCNKSTGEIQVEDHLKKNKIDYITQYSFRGCKNKLLLHFDFYLPQYNLCIEYDGKQHFKPYPLITDKGKALRILEATQKNDAIKNDFCKRNKIKLIRIPFTLKKNIIKILNDNLKIL
jgi:very-short-patch-repair endonuclease